jgi:uncharacterized protein YjbI with pentapeptide repeats
MTVTPEFLADQARESRRARRCEIAATLGIEVLIGVVLSGILAWVLADWQNDLEDRRQEAVMKADQLAAEQAEVLSNVTYIRDVLAEDKPRDFRYLNLRGANLAGMDLGCDVLVTTLAEAATTASAKEGGAPLAILVGTTTATTLLTEIAEIDRKPSVFVVPRDKESCTDLTGADLTGATLDGTDLTGARLERTQFAPASSNGVRLAGARLSGNIDAHFLRSDMRGTWFIHETDESWTNSRISATDTMLDAAVIKAPRYEGDGLYKPFTVTRSEAMSTEWAPGTVACGGQAVTDGDFWCSEAGKLDQEHFSTKQQKKFYSAFGCATTQWGAILQVVCFREDYPANS